MKNNSFFYRLRVGISKWYALYVKNLDRSKFGYIADDVDLIPPLDITNPQNIFLYGGNGLKDALIAAKNAKFIMMPHSRAGQGLKVSTGNRAMVLGRFFASIKESEKPDGLDKDVVVESDVFIGRNVQLLSGVHIGRGCTVAAGSVVTKSMPPYCIIAGVPAKPIKVKWSIDEILYHESVLYPEKERFSKEELTKIYQDYNLMSALPQRKVEVGQ